MGVPRFYKYLSRKYPSVITTKLPSNAASLAIDMNGIFHTIGSKVYGLDSSYTPQEKAKIQRRARKTLDNEFLIGVVTKLMELVRMVKPREILIMAVDGVVPLSKIQQQRQRRYRAAMDAEADSIFDRNAFTPGTELMTRLDTYINLWIIASQAYLPNTVIYSSYQVPGEGEHKIMDIYRTNRLRGRKGVHVLYGLDADLILLALAAPLRHIQLMRESEFRIDGLKIAPLRNLIPVPINDFIIIMALMGNDFLPKHPGLKDMEYGMEQIIDAYKEAKITSFTNDDKTVNLGELLKYFKQLCEREVAFLEHERERNPKFPSTLFSESMENGKVNYDTYRAYWYGKEAGEETTTISAEMVPEMCQDYIRGLCWIYRYYTKGHNSVTNQYVYRFLHAPLFCDVVEAFDNFSYDPAKPADEPEIGIPTQLLSVMPPKSFPLLPLELSSNLEQENMLADNFPYEIEVDMDGVDESYQGVSLIYPACFDKINIFVEMIEFTPRHEKSLAIKTTHNTYIRNAGQMAEIRAKFDIRDKLKILRDEFKGKARPMKRVRPASNIPKADVKEWSMKKEISF